MDFERIPFGKKATLNSWTLSSSQKGTCSNESKHTIFFKCYDSLVQVPFCEDESVQLFRVAFFSKRTSFKIHTLASTFFLEYYFWNCTWRWWQRALLIIGNIGLKWSISVESKMPLLSIIIAKVNSIIQFFFYQKRPLECEIRSQPFGIRSGMCYTYLK